MKISKLDFIELIDNSKEIRNLELSGVLIDDVGRALHGYTFVNCNFDGNIGGGGYFRCVFINCRLTKIDSKFETSVFFNCAFEMCTIDSEVCFGGNYLINCVCKGLRSFLDEYPDSNSFIGCDIEDRISDYPTYHLKGHGPQEEFEINTNSKTENNNQIKEKMGQEHYDQWVMRTNAARQDNLCGGNRIFSNENFFIDKYAKSNILDIGCGTGHRTFPKWNKRNLNFSGLEKFQNLIDASSYKEKIFLADISEKEFKETVRKISIENIDIAFLFGGVINGLIDKEKQNMTWDNFNFLLDKCNYILIDTLTHFSWYETAETGKEEQLNPDFPTQYFYSKKELEKLNNTHSLEFCEELTEDLGPVRRTHYLLRKKGN